MLLLEPFVEGRFTKWIKNTGDVLKVPRAKHLTPADKQDYPF